MNPTIEITRWWRTDEKPITAETQTAITGLAVVKNNLGLPELHVDTKTRWIHVHLAGRAKPVRDNADDIRLAAITAGDKANYDDLIHQDRVEMEIHVADNDGDEETWITFLIKDLDPVMAETLQGGLRFESQNKEQWEMLFLPFPTLEELAKRETITHWTAPQPTPEPANA